jgi:hypothetical protein
VSDRAYLALLMLVLSGLAFGLIAGHGPWAGRELFAVSETHGLNIGDVPILAAWLVGAGCCWRLWSRKDR